MLIYFDVVKLQTRIPVLIEVDPEKFKVGGPENRKLLENPQEFMPKLIDKGLRAELTTQSFITGQLMIELNFHPESIVILNGFTQEYIEIPTIPSKTKQLEKNLEKALAGIDKFVNDPDLAASIRALKETLLTVRKLAARAGPPGDPLGGRLQKNHQRFPPVVPRS